MLQDVFGAVLFRNQLLDALAYELIARPAEHGLGFAIHQADRAGAVGHDDRVRREFEQVVEAPRAALLLDLSRRRNGEDMENRCEAPRVGERAAAHDGKLADAGSRMIDERDRGKPFHATRRQKWARCTNATGNHHGAIERVFGPRRFAQRAGEVGRELAVLVHGQRLQDELPLFHLDPGYDCDLALEQGCELLHHPAEEGCALQRNELGGEHTKRLLHQLLLGHICQRADVARNGALRIHRGYGLHQDRDGLAVRTDKTAVAVVRLPQLQRSLPFSHHTLPVVRMQGGGACPAKAEGGLATDAEHLAITLVYVQALRVSVHPYDSNRRQPCERLEGGGTPLHFRFEAGVELLEGFLGRPTAQGAAPSLDQAAVSGEQRLDLSEDAVIVSARSVRDAHDADDFVRYQDWNSYERCRVLLRRDFARRDGLIDQRHVQVPGPA